MVMILLTYTCHRQKPFDSFHVLFKIGIGDLFIPKFLEILKHILRKCFVLVDFIVLVFQINRFSLFELIVEQVAVSQVRKNPKLAGIDFQGLLQPPRWPPGDGG